MALEPLVLVAVLALLLVPVVASLARSRGRRGLLVAALTIAALPAAVAWVRHREADRRELERLEQYRPIAVADGGYVGSDTCIGCHPDEYDSWHASYHRTMTQVASAQSVLAPIDGVVLEGQGRTYRLSRHGDQVWVTIDNDGQTSHRPLSLVTGSHHMQVYWLPTGQTRKLGMFPFYYDIEADRWAPRSAAFIIPPEHEEPFGMGRWNRTCALCHATHSQPLISDDDRMDSRVAEFGIACEACHGPAEEHVKLNRSPLRRYGLWVDAESHDASVTQPARLLKERSTEVCAQCHSVQDLDADEFYTRDLPYRPGDDLTESRVFPISGHDKERFWADGMVRVSGREFSGLLRTGCYTDGDMTCLSCHSMHQTSDDPRPVKEWANDQLKPGMDGDAACLQCHSAFSDRIAEHTHHEPDSEGSRCYNCHMSYTTYGLHKAIRSHQVDSPTVQASVNVGRPNACNQCHLDQTLAWAGEHLERWYGTPRPALDEDQRRVAASLLWLLRGDAGQRALMAWSFGWEAAREASGSEWMAPYLAQLLEDPYHSVRYIALRSLRRLDGYAGLEADFMAPEPERRLLRERALAAWRPPETERAAVLMTGRGIDAAELSRLLQQRDDRPVTLVE